MLCNRITQFREYNKISPDSIAKSLGITKDDYLKFESGERIPDIDTLTKLSMIYKVTLNEFYGRTPRLQLHYEEPVFSKTDEDFEALKFAELTIDEKELILAYRLTEDKTKFLNLINDEEKK